MRNIIRAAVLGLTLFSLGSVADLKEGEAAPSFKVKTHDGADFDLVQRKGKWTVLYFYPKADTPGCTKQACAFRDNLQKVRDLGAEVFGISVNTVEEQAAFHKKHQLNFTLLADASGQIGELYGAKPKGGSVSRRWTFIIDPELKVRAVDRQVDPVMDPDRVVAHLKSLQKK